VQTAWRQFAESVELKRDLLEQQQHAADCSNHKHHTLPHNKIQRHVTAAHTMSVEKLARWDVSPHVCHNESGTLHLWQNYENLVNVSDVE